MLKHVFVILGIIFLVGIVDAVTWTSANGCWTATDGSYDLIMWNTTGTHVWNATGANVSEVEYLVVGGGGAGGMRGLRGGGGGGAGGVLNATGFSVSGLITISVGKGGTPVADTINSIRGENSSFSTIIAVGGGSGKWDTTSLNASGGSGGGANGIVGATYGDGISGQGYHGGDAKQVGNDYSAGGGGGAGGVGENSTSHGGNGGIGRLSDITGENIYYGGGGGGGTANQTAVSPWIGGTGGLGGGANGTNSTTTVAANGTHGLGGGGGGGSTVSGGYGGSGVVIIRYSASPQAPVASFTANNTESIFPIPVQFNDTSSYLPTEWNWSFTNVTGNNTEIWFSTEQNPIYYFGVGNYSIVLNASNAFGSNISTQITFINITIIPNLPIPSFTSNVTMGTAPLPVQFTDTSETDITNWLWDFNDGNTSTDQNPEHTFYNGNWNIHLNVTNASGSAVSAGNYYINVSESGGLSGFNRQDIMMDQIYTVTISVKDELTRLAIPSATVITSTGDSATTNLVGTVTFSMNYTVLLVTVGKSGYSTRSVSYIVDRDRNVTIYMTPINDGGSASSFTNWAATHYVEFRVRSWTGAPVKNVNITATYVETSGPLDWIYSWAGVPTNVSVQNTTMFGHTGDDGVVTFLMVPSVQYEVIAQKTGEVDESMTVYPQDDYYNIWVGGGANASNMYSSGYNELDVIKFSTNGTEINSTHGRIHVEYIDLLSQTTSATVFVNQSTSVGNTTTETTVASYTSTAAGNFTYDFDLAGARDKSYIVRMRSTGTTFTNVSRDYGVTFPPGPITLGIPEPLLVYAGMFALIFIALCFTRTLPGPATIIIMFFAWIFYFMRWWNNMAPEWVVVTALTFFSILAVVFNVMIRSKKRNFES